MENTDLTAEEQHAADVADPRIVALAAFLECDLDDISESRYDSHAFDAPGGEYLVLDDEEADQACADNIRESVWAFNASFLQGYGAFAELDADDIDRLRGDKCEDINGAFLRMIGDDFDAFVSDAISADGRAHFLSTYDGHENEAGGFYIYRTN